MKIPPRESIDRVARACFIWGGAILLLTGVGLLAYKVYLNDPGQIGHATSTLTAFPTPTGASTR